MPSSAKAITVSESKRASLERAFTHRPYAYNGINSHTARNKSSVSHIQTIRWKYVLADTYFHLM